MSSSLPSARVTVTERTHCTGARSENKGVNTGLWHGGVIYLEGMELIYIVLCTDLCCHSNAGGKIIKLAITAVDITQACYALCEYAKTKNTTDELENSGSVYLS